MCIRVKKVLNRLRIYFQVDELEERLCGCILVVVSVNVGFL